MRSNGQDDLAMLEDALKKNPDLDCTQWLNNWAARGRADLLRIAFKYNRLNLSDDHSVIDSSVRPVNEIYPEEGDRVEAARFMIDHGIDIEGLNEENRSYLHHFPRTVHWYDRYLEVAELVIDHGADLNRRENMQNLTPLGWAVKWNNLDYASLLLQKGAKPNLPDDEAGITPLAIAYNKGFMAMATLLEKYGAKT